MKKVFLLFPHQLFANIEPLSAANKVYLIEKELSDLRMFLIDEVLTTQYSAATMEPTTIGDESKIYSNLSSTQTDKPSVLTT